MDLATPLQAFLDRNAIDIRINGSRPWDIRINNPAIYQRAVRQGVLGLGDSYMDGWWDCDQIDEMFFRLSQAPALPNFGWGIADSVSKAAAAMKIGRKQTAFKVGEEHYDLGNELYEFMLDKRLTYTCGYWGSGAHTLDEAQEDKLERTSSKLMLEPGQRVLDIGSGWGSFLGYASEKYKVKTTGLTVSKEQAAYADKRYGKFGAQTLVQDYRDHQPEQPYDRIVSIGMFEHVGDPSYRTFMKTVDRLLAKDGVFVLHTIGKPEANTRMDPWMQKHIFPNAELPSQKAIMKAAAGIFRVEHWENFGRDYDRTLMCWLENFDKHWEELVAGNPQQYNERFRRMWRLYLAGCAGNFRGRGIQLWQLVFAKNTAPREYRWPKPE